MLGILLLPYRCDRCSYRFWRWRWLSPFPDSEVPESLWTTGRVGIPLALAIIAVSVTLVVMRWSRPHRGTEQNTADRNEPVESQARPDRLATAPGGAHPAQKQLTTSPSPSRYQSAEFRGPHLQSQTPVAVVAVSEASALRLRRRSRSLGELIREGSVFSVPNGTAIAILERKNGLVRIRIMESALAGRDGWAQPSQVASK